MIDFSNLHPLIVDISLVCIFILIIFFGALKGIKNVLVDSVISLIAFILGFSPWMNGVKEIFARELFQVDKVVPAGSTNLYKFGIYIFTNLVSALLLFLLLYVVLQAIRSAIKLISKAQPKPKSKVGRVFGSVVSLVYNGIFLLLLLVVADNNFIGLNQVFDKTTVANFLTNTTNDVIVKIDKNLDSELTIKALNGDVFYEVSEEAVTSFNYIDGHVANIFLDKNYIDLVNDANITNDDAQIYIKDRILDLHQLAIFTINTDQFGIGKEKFSVVAEDLLIAMHRRVFSSGMNKIEFTMTDVGNIKHKLELAGMNEKSASFYDEITIGK